MQVFPKTKENLRKTDKKEVKKHLKCVSCGSEKLTIDEVTGGFICCDCGCLFFEDWEVK